MHIAFRRRLPQTHTEVIRCVVLSIWFVNVLATPLGSYAALLPDPLPDIMVLQLVSQLDGDHLMRSSAVLSIFKYLLMVMLVAASVTRSSAILVAATFLVYVHESVCKSIGGYLNHAQVVPLIMLSLLTLQAVSVANDSAKKEQEWLVWLCRITVVIPYFYTGLERLLSARWTWLAEPPLIEYLQLSNPDLMSLLPTGSTTLLVAATLTLVLVTVLELLSPMVIPWRRQRLHWLAAIGLFHSATLFTMNIFFWENWLCAAAVFGFDDSLRHARVD